MKRFSIALVLGLLGGFCLAGQELPQWVLSLSKIKRQAKAELSLIPNYACRETVNRSRKTPKDASFKAVDVLRLEVAFIGGKELFAPVGAAQFQELDLSVYAANGALGTGAFTTVPRNLFVNDRGQTKGWGEEKLGERATLWYEYEIPEMLHAYRLSTASAQVFVGQRGKFWVDAESLELLRIEDRAVDIPEYLDVRAVTTAIDYGKVKIGPNLVLLPLVAETTVTDSGGTQNKNVIEFSGCREYGSESVIRFGPEEPTPPPPIATKKK